MRTHEKGFISHIFLFVLGFVALYLIGVNVLDLPFMDDVEETFERILDYLLSLI